MMKLSSHPRSCKTEGNEVTILIKPIHRAWLVQSIKILIIIENGSFQAVKKQASLNLIFIELEVDQILMFLRLFKIHSDHELE